MMPPEATVANKTGNWEAAAHDVAIVYGPRATIVIALLSDGIDDFDGLYTAMATAARNVYDLANDPTFGSSANPPLPGGAVASYQMPVRLPGSNASPPGPTRSAAPAEKPRPTAPAPRVPAPAPKPVAKPAEAPSGASVDKPAGQPSAPSSGPPGEAPAIKPAAPSIFVMPTKTP
jgi:hypothetical protein